MSNDSYTEVTTTSFMQRIGNSIKGIFTGLLLILVGTVLLYWNEGRSVREAGAIAKAYDEDFNLMHTFSLPMLQEDVHKLKYISTIAAVILPWRIQYRTSSSSYYVYEISFTENYTLTIISHIICLFIFVMLVRNKMLRASYFDYFFIAFFGVIGLLVITIFLHKRRSVL